MTGFWWELDVEVLKMFERLVDNHVLSSFVTLQLSTVSGFCFNLRMFQHSSGPPPRAIKTVMIAWAFSIVPASLVATAA